MVFAGHAVHALEKGWDDFAGANLKGNRKLFLEHRMHRGVPLNASLKGQVLPHIERLWGHEVSLEEIAPE